MIDYEVPGLTEFTDIVLAFVYMTNAHPDMLIDGVHIGSVYGGFPGSRLCGGRNNAGARIPREKIERIVYEFNEQGVGCNATFTNQFFTPDLLEESAYEMDILDILAAEEGNGAIVYSDDIAETIRRRWPSLKLIASTTRAPKTPSKVNADMERFDRVVLDYDFSKDEDFIAQVQPASHLEIMVNEYCRLGCPYRAEHYADVSRAQMEGRRSTFKCRHAPSPQAFGFLQGLIDGDVFLHKEDVRRYEERFGVENFKIVGRGMERYDVSDALLYYLIRLDGWYTLRDFLIEHHMV